MKMTLDELRVVVAAELREEVTEEQREWLEAHPDIWIEGLKDLLSDLDQQFREREAKLKTDLSSVRLRPHGEHEAQVIQDEYDEWKRRASGFKMYVQRRLRDTKLKIRQQDEDAGDAKAVVAMLVKAIETHRKKILEDEETVFAECDSELYSHLDRVPEWMKEKARNIA